jgi:hypothetical protein
LATRTRAPAIRKDSLGIWKTGTSGPIDAGQSGF